MWRCSQHLTAIKGPSTRRENFSVLLPVRRFISLPWYLGGEVLSRSGEHRYFTPRIHAVVLCVLAVCRSGAEPNTTNTMNALLIMGHFTSESR